MKTYEYMDDRLIFPTVGRDIIATNLHPNRREAWLLNFFSQFGQVVRIVYNELKDEAVVTYLTFKQAVTCIESTAYHWSSCSEYPDTRRVEIRFFSRYPTICFGRVRTIYEEYALKSFIQREVLKDVVQRNPIVRSEWIIDENGDSTVMFTFRNDKVYEVVVKHIQENNFPKTILNRRDPITVSRRKLLYVSVKADWISNIRKSEFFAKLGVPEVSLSHMLVIGHSEAYLFCNTFESVVKLNEAIRKKFERK